MTEVNEKRIELSRSDRIKVFNRHQLLQGSWNYERMQNGGWCYSIIPAIKKLYKSDEDRKSALKRHLEFYNTHPYLSSPVMGVTLAMAEERANGAPIEDKTINSVKVGMMGPLAGVGDPVFWFTARPIIGALGASMALTGNILGPILFFVLWNIIRMLFEWKSQEFGYRVGNEITKDLSGGLLGKVNLVASIVGMFIVGALVQRWVNVTFTVNVSEVTQQAGSYIDWNSLSSGSKGLQEAFKLYDQLGSAGLDQVKVTTLQDNLNQLIPGLVPVLLTLGICKLLKKNVSPIVIIVALFIIGIIASVLGIM